MRIVALLGGRGGKPLHINRGKMETSPVFIEMLRFKGMIGQNLVGARGISGTG